MNQSKNLFSVATNSLGLLLLASFLAGCQKTVIQKKGLFTQLSGPNSAGRVPASANIAKDFLEFQDHKQIYIYCELNEASANRCYSEALKISLEEFAIKQKLSTKELEPVKKELSFQKAQAETQEVLKHVFKQIQPKISALVDKRAAFCKENSTVDLDRCLRQYLNKETLQVLNSYQEKNKAMNGREYLYLKAHIEDNFKQRLANAFSSIKSEQKKNLLEDLKTSLKLKSKTLLAQRSWLTNINSLIGAKNACVSRSLEGVDVPEELSQTEAKELALESVCLDMLSHPEIKNVVNEKSYAAFERKLKDFEKALAKSSGAWEKKCEGENKLKFLSCLSRAWPKKTEEIFEKWANLAANKEFKNQKGLFIMRATNNADRIKREIASEKDF